MRHAPLTWTARSGEHEGTTILCLEGPLTLENLFTFQNEFRSTRPPLLIVDMSKVPYMDSAGLGLLLSAHVSAQNGNRKFSLACVNDRVMTLLRLTRVDTVLKVFRSNSEAENGNLT